MRRVMLFLVVCLAVQLSAQEVRSTYHEDGQIKNTYVINGDFVNFTSFYTNGKVNEIGAYYMGKPHGIWLKHSEDGELISRAKYERGDKTGVWQINTPESATYYELQYDDGTRIGARRVE